MRAELIERGGMMKEYPEKFQHGVISVENVPEGLFLGRMLECDLGIKIATDGRIWLCVNGLAFIRFKPLPITKEESRPEDGQLPVRT